MSKISHSGTLKNLDLSSVHEIHIYREYNSVCLLVGIGTRAHPLSRKRVCSLPRNQRGGGTLDCGWGGGESQFGRPKKKLILCLLCGSVLLQFRGMEKTKRNIVFKNKFWCWLHLKKRFCSSMQINDAENMSVLYSLTDCTVELNYF
jgi:hypothetical protein